MSIHDELHQKLFEFIYGLLPEDEAHQLNQRITSEPEVARAYAEAKQQADMLAKAAKMHGPPVKLQRPQDASPKVVGAYQPGGAMLGMRWLVGLAAAALLCVTGYNAWKTSAELASADPDQTRREIADSHLRIVVTAPAQFSEGAPGLLSLATTSVDRRPLAANIRYTVYAPDSDEILESEETATGEDGRATIELSRAALKPGARLEVTAENGRDAVQMSTRLQVEPIRYATQLTTDKPLYRPGETVRYRSLTLTRFGLQSERELPVSVHIFDPAGGIVPGSQQTGYTNHGVLSGEFKIPPHFSGGTYVLVAKSAEREPAFPEEQREFFIRQYRLPRLKKQLEFTRDSYSPGDEVVADFLAERTEGGAAAGAQLHVSAVVDGQTVFGSSPQANSQGSHQITFTLPKEIATGDATLSVIVDDGGNRETIAKTIPINLGKIEIQFYPEGGELVAGLENRVYFFGHDPLGEPVHIESGRIVDANGKEVAPFATYHEGRGALSFTPKSGEKYEVEIIEPADVEVIGELPPVRNSPAVVMNTGNGVFAAGKPIELHVLAKKADVPLVIAAVCRGTQVAQREFQTASVRGLAEATENSRITLNVPVDVSGVVRLTLYDYSASPPRPLAERLVYRRPERKLNVSMDGAPTEYSPGEHVRLSLKVTDENGRPHPAALGVAVVDDALLNLADDKSPQLPTYFYLASEIERPEDLEDANFYLLQQREKDKDPSKALDLLLGTQGWRRFVHLEEQLDALADKPSPEAASPAREGDVPETAEDQERSAAVARLLAMEGPEKFPTVYDNLEEIEEGYAADVAQRNRERKSAIVSMGYTSLFGGAVLMVVILIMSILRVAGDARFWLPVTVAASLSLAIGFAWTGRQVDDEGGLRLAGFANFDAAQVIAMTDEEVQSEAPTDATEPAVGFDDPGAVPVPADAPLNAPDEPAGVPAEEDVADVAEALDDGVLALDPAPQAGAADDLTPAGEPRPVVPPAAPIADADFDALMAEEATDLPRFDALGPLGNELREFANDISVDGERLRFDGTIADVARLRRMLDAAVDSGKREVAEAIRKAYEDRLAKFQIPARLYAHQHVAGEPGVRSDFTETLYWHPLLIADEDGITEIEFDLSDSVTTFVVKADAHGTNAAGVSRIGTGGGEIVSRIPFSLEPKLPLEVNAGDRIELPLAISNDSRQELPVEVALTHTGELVALDGDAKRTLNLAAGQRSREYYTLNVVGQSGEAELKFTGLAGPLADGISKRLVVVPPGFPVSKSYSGQIDGEQKITVTLPEEWVDGSLEVKLTAFPSSLADLQQGMAGMLRDPNGCFEQTSSSNYPNVLALTYMEEHNVADPQFTRRAKDLLQRGYDKLVSFECQEPTSDKKAFEWFGGWPAHEALTAYGVLEFRDMQKVYDVDQAMIDRAAMWLLSRRDGEGGFKRNPRALDSFGGAPQEITNAYIVWALTEANQKGIEKEIDHVIATASKSHDPYVIALAAASAHNAGRMDEAKELMQQLAEHQEDDGRLDAKETSITRSGGISLKVETTALAALAWLKDPAMTAHANKAVKWIVENRDGSGGFGATQSTIMALKALVEHAAANKKTVAAGELIVQRDGEPVAAQAFGAGEINAVTIDGLSAQLAPGENELAISLTGENEMPYALEVRYRTRQPVSDAACPVRLTTSLSQEEATAGETIRLNVGLKNITDKGQPMTVAIVGLPAGLEPRVEHLEELKDAAEFDYYELEGREIIFYWRGLAARASDDDDSADVDFDVDLIAEIPGKFTGPASRAYLYYTPEQKHWVLPLSATIARE